MNAALKFVCFIFLVTVPLCIADNSVQQQQPYSPANFARWRAFFEQSHPEKDYPKIGQEFYKMNDRKNPSNNIIESNDRNSFDEYFAEKELEPDMSYGIQNARDVSSRAANEHYHNHENPRLFKTNFQSLCPTKIHKVYLNSTEFEYHPAEYEEVLCVHGYTNAQEYIPNRNRMCSEAGFTCIQVTRKMYLTLKYPNSDCAVTVDRNVGTGCECMWPQHLGDIATYH